MLKKEFDLFEYPKLLEVLKYLYVNGERNVTDISENVNARFEYISKQLKILKKLYLIKKRKSGREVYISLTNKGKEVGKRVYEICGELK